ncbi:hypothetical protein EJ03DRAFT_378506 [Teratosphaeria nubilosa]|uniref:RNA recognition motif-containing protein n=1 Tax=Teratosphaeria nubilosa TaxID=161662 RepID=A0A6G1KVE5_9PEZI|nr:hypothetical protein EJ03DRAFT_378506 [Teratosphaeria nubilosa]
MPAAAGESLLTTLFADVHYYFADPSTKPPHHRFDRGSYVYVYHNSHLHQAKLEIANHAGTPEQDAFSAYLLGARVEFSYKHPTLVSLRVDAVVPDQTQWHLPSYNERNERKYLYKLNTLHLYLWTERDAATLLGHLKAVMPASRLDISDAPSAAANVTPVKATSPAEHRDSMSPVVQQLEKTAIGTHFPRAGSAVSAQSLPGPPTPATPAGASSPPVSPPQQTIAAPFAYNPAAPPAPEPIAYREKTPPPLDDGTGTGLQNVAKYDAMPQQYANVPQGYQNSAQATPQGAYFPGHVPQSPGFTGPPLASPQTAQFPGQMPPPPSGPSPAQQQQQQQYAPSFGSPPTTGHSPQHLPSFAGPPSNNHTPQPTSPPPHQQSFHRQSSYSGPPVQQFASYPSTTPSFGPNAIATPGFSTIQPPTPSAPPAYAGHTPLSSPGLPPPPPSQPQAYNPAATQQQQPPRSQQHQTFGYSSYNYTATHVSHQPAINSYGQYTGDIHTQLYRHTEAEAAHSHGHGAKKERPVVGERSETKERLEQRVQGVEKRVGGFLKRLDKLI